MYLPHNSIRDGKIRVSSPPPPHTLASAPSVSIVPRDCRRDHLGEPVRAQLIFARCERIVLFALVVKETDFVRSRVNNASRIFG